jgi:GntR family transcriptional regulator/MocR family aminotransferase
MSLPRRLALLELASQANAWILEDDYDSEYRFASRPLAALQGLDSEGRVMYLGAYSKVLFPALRLGHLVVPMNLASAFAAARAIAGLSSPSIEQAVLADFIAEGHFARHIRRMRTLYAERQEALVEAATRKLTGLLEVSPTETGLHLVGWLPEGVDDRMASQRAAIHGVETRALSLYRMEPSCRGGLVLGYAAFTPTEIRAGIGKLATALRTVVADS